MKDAYSSVQKLDWQGTVQIEISRILSFLHFSQRLTSQCKSSTCAQLAFRLATHLCGLASTCDDLVGLYWLWSSSNLHASRHKFFTVWPHTPSRHKLIVDCICVNFLGPFANCKRTCRLAVWPPIASLYPSSLVVWKPPDVRRLFLQATSSSGFI